MTRYLIALLLAASSLCICAQQFDVIATSTILKASPTWLAQNREITVFKLQIEELESLGYRLVERWTGSLDNRNLHLAAIYENPNFNIHDTNSWKERYILKLYEYDGSNSYSILNASNFYLSFVQRHNGSDVNGDGLKEIVVNSADGGNCQACSEILIFQVKNGRADRISEFSPDWVIPKRLDDLNNDGVYELICSDSRWDMYEGVTHDRSPDIMIIYAWKVDRYRYASREFSSVYRVEIDQAHRKIEEANMAPDDIAHDELLVSAAIELLLNYIHAGDKERGWKEFIKLVTPQSFKTNDWKKKFDKIVADLANELNFSLELN